MLQNSRLSLLQSSLTAGVEETLFSCRVYRLVMVRHRNDMKVDLLPAFNTILRHTTKQKTTNQAIYDIKVVSRNLN